MATLTLDNMLHRLWTKAVGQPGYNKAEWRFLEKALREGQGLAQMVKNLPGCPLMPELLYEDDGGD